MDPYFPFLAAKICGSVQENKIRQLTNGWNYLVPHAIYYYLYTEREREVGIIHQEGIPLVLFHVWVVSVEIKESQIRGNTTLCCSSKYIF